MSIACLIILRHIIRLLTKKKKTFRDDILNPFNMCSIQEFKPN